MPLAAACRPPDPARGFTLLFLDRSPAARVAGLSWAPDPAHSRLVAFDGDLRLVRTVRTPRLASPVAVAALGRSLLVTERTGEGLVMQRDGIVREWPSPFPAALYAARGERVIAARSPYFVQFVGEDGGDPLLWLLDTLGQPVHGIGTIRVPRVRYFAQLVNAGAIALGSGDAVFYAPLVRDEVVKLDGAGRPVWRTTRGLYPRERDPQLVGEGERRVVHAFVNFALALGPDGHLYALGANDSAGMHLRLDAIDTASGRIVRTRAIGTPGGEAAVAVDRRGNVRLLDAAALLAQAPTLGREAFAPPFALPTLAGGDTVRLAEYRGKVTLVNFWASWCDPCREEFPHMAELYRDFSRDDFDIAAISDDVDAGQMRAFVRQFRPPFPILVGGGRMKQVYHYRGLPYSVLLDRRGRVIERIFGFGGERDFARLRETIAREIREP